MGWLWLELQTINELFDGIDTIYTCYYTGLGRATGTVNPVESWLNVISRENGFAPTKYRMVIPVRHSWIHDSSYSIIKMIHQKSFTLIWIGSQLRPSIESIKFIRIEKSCLNSTQSLVDNLSNTSLWFARFSLWKIFENQIRDLFIEHLERNTTVLYMYRYKSLLRHFMLSEIFPSNTLSTLQQWIALDYTIYYTIWWE